VGVFNYKDIYCEMKQLIKNILREHMLDKYSNQILDSIKKYGLSVSITAYSKPKLTYVDGKRKIEHVPFGDISFKINSSSGDAFFKTIIAGDQGEVTEYVFNLLCGLAGKSPKSVKNIMDLQSDSNGSIFLIYEEGILYLAHEEMGCTSISNDPDLNSATLIRDKVWAPGGPYFTNVTNLSRLREVNCNLWVGNNLEYIGGLEKVMGELSFSGNDVKLIDTIKEVGKLNIHDGNVKSLGSIEKCHGKCRIASNCEDLGELKYVGGDLFIQSPNLISTGKVKVVKGNLRIRNTNVIDFPNLETVEGKVLVSRTMDPNVIKLLKEKGFNVVRG
jgi:hypothetical protein